MPRRIAIPATISAAEDNGQECGFVLVDQNGIETHNPKTFAALAAIFEQYK